MPKREPTTLACPLCLGLDDPQSMVEVAIERTNPPDAVIIALCRRCAFAVAKALASSDQPELLDTPIVESLAEMNERVERQAVDVGALLKKQDQG